MATHCVRWFRTLDHVPEVELGLTGLCQENSIGRTRRRCRRKIRGRLNLFQLRCVRGLELDMRSYRYRGTLGAPEYSLRRGAEQNHLQTPAAMRPHYNQGHILVFDKGRNHIPGIPLSDQGFMLDAVEEALHAPRLLIGKLVRGLS
jgi:hypothetical protein